MCCCEYYFCNRKRYDLKVESCLYVWEMFEGLCYFSRESEKINDSCSGIRFIENVRYIVFFWRSKSVKKSGSRCYYFSR